MSWAVQEGGDWWFCRNQVRSTEGKEGKLWLPSPQHCTLTSSSWGAI